MYPAAPSGYPGDFPGKIKIKKANYYWHRFSTASTSTMDDSCLAPEPRTPDALSDKVHTIR